jgi:outer membrane protein assembly factor BamB
LAVETLASPSRQEAEPLKAFSVNATLCAALVATPLSGCNAAPEGAAQVLPATDARAPIHRIEVRLVIQIPERRRRRLFKPAYVSPATQSLSLEIAALRSGKVVINEIVNVAPGSPGCKESAANRTCTIDDIYLAPGVYEATVAAYAGRNGKGSLLSQGQQVPFSLAVGTSNELRLTLYGVPVSYIVVPNSAAVNGTMRGGFTIGGAGVWGNAQPFLVAALDASGNIIAGPGAPMFTLSSSNQDFTLSQPTEGSPSGFSVTPPANVAGASAQLMLQAAFSDPAICRENDAVCSASFDVTYAPFAGDDWITFAHDFQRTGLQTQPTGISAQTVSLLKQRWRIRLPSAIYSSPVVYDGNVLVGTYSGRLYDLSAVNGAVLWETTLANASGDHLKGSPMIDTADGLVFMGTWYNTAGAQPSVLYAVRLSNGSVVWNDTLTGMIRSAPVYANGVVYEGWAGGDEPYCINGGVSAFNAQTGAVQWTWLTNPFTNPGGGGGIWGALAWDGTHVMFGTGNTCQNGPYDQGAVALYPNGSMAWSFQADPTIGFDDDTGSGVMIQNGSATFMNKNGSLYTVDDATGSKLLSTALGATSGNGGFATPTSDGATVVVGAGYFPTSSATRGNVICWRCRKPGVVMKDYSSYLKAISPTGTILWALPMNSSIDSYAAIDNGVVFAGMDNEMDAIALETGTILSAFRGAGIFEAGPVIVPSGLYVADYAGYVYAYSLPPVGTSASAPSRAGTQRGKP